MPILCLYIAVTPKLMGRRGHHADPMERLRYVFSFFAASFFFANNFFLMRLSIIAAQIAITPPIAAIDPCGMLKTSVPMPIMGKKIKITIAACRKSYFVTSRDSRSFSSGGGKSSILFDVIVLIAFHFNITPELSGPAKPGPS